LRYCYSAGVGEENRPEYFVELNSIAPDKEVARKYDEHGFLPTRYRRCEILWYLSARINQFTAVVSYLLRSFIRLRLHRQTRSGSYG
jgi:hypothetical protein